MQPGPERGRLRKRECVGHHRLRVQRRLGHACDFGCVERFGGHSLGHGRKRLNQVRRVNAHLANARLARWPGAGLRHAAGLPRRQPRQEEQAARCGHHATQRGTPAQHGTAGAGQHREQVAGTRHGAHDRRRVLGRVLGRVVAHGGSLLHVARLHLRRVVQPGQEHRRPRPGCSPSAAPRRNGAPRPERPPAETGSPAGRRRQAVRRQTLPHPAGQAGPGRRRGTGAAALAGVRVRRAAWPAQSARLRPTGWPAHRRPARPHRQPAGCRTQARRPKPARPGGPAGQPGATRRPGFSEATTCPRQAGQRSRHGCQRPGLPALWRGHGASQGAERPRPA